MDAFIAQVLSGLVTGGIYASVALALVMIYQATHLVNFAQGELLLIGIAQVMNLASARDARHEVFQHGKIRIDVRQITKRQARADQAIVQLGAFSDANAAIVQKGAAPTAGGK